MAEWRRKFLADLGPDHHHGEPDSNPRRGGTAPGEFEIAHFEKLGVEPATMPSPIFRQTEFRGADRQRAICLTAGAQQGGRGASSTVRSRACWVMAVAD